MDTMGIPGVLLDCNQSYCPNTLPRSVRPSVRAFWSSFGHWTTGPHKAQRVRERGTCSVVDCAIVPLNLLLHFFIFNRGLGFLYMSPNGTSTASRIERFNFHPKPDTDPECLETFESKPKANMGGCQNYGPFLDPYYNTAPNI